MVLHVLLPAATVPCTEPGKVVVRAAAAVQGAQCGTSIPVFQPVADVLQEEWTSQAQGQSCRGERHDFASHALVAEVPQSCPIAASPDSGHAEEECGVRVHPGGLQGLHFLSSRCSTEVQAGGLCHGTLEQLGCQPLSAGGRLSLVVPHNSKAAHGAPHCFFGRDNFAKASVVLFWRGLHEDSSCSGQELGHWNKAKYGLQQDAGTLEDRDAPSPGSLEVSSKKDTICMQPTACSMFILSSLTCLLAGKSAYWQARVDAACLLLSVFCLLTDQWWLHAYYMIFFATCLLDLGVACLLL